MFSHETTEIKHMDETIIIHKEAQLLDLSVEYETIHLHDRIISNLICG